MIGGGTGRLRAAHGVPALGDLRRAVGALAPEGASAGLPLEHRFEPPSQLAGHTFGNLVLLGMALAGGLQEAVDQLAALLHAQGQVVPTTLENVDLRARLKDGAVIVGEAAIDARGSSAVGIDTIDLSPPADANPRALAAIRAADAVVLGPGDLYTSVLPSLLVRGVSEAIADSAGRRIFVGNLTTKVGETDGYRVSDFLRELLRYLGTADPLDVAVLDSGLAGASGVSEAAPGVEQDLDSCRDLVRHIVPRPVASSADPGRHDPERTAAALMEALDLPR